MNELNVSVKPAEGIKDYYSLVINGQLIGIYERSELRHAIAIIDQAIVVGLIGEKKTEMSKEDYAAMIAAAREAALNENDEDGCIMCSG
jgi:phage anti-repressor protein